MHVSGRIRLDVSCVRMCLIIPLSSEAGKHTGVTFIIISLCEARLIRDAEVRDTGNYAAVLPGILEKLLRACVLCRKRVHGRA